MSVQLTLRRCFATALAVCLFGLYAAPAVAAPTTAQTAADRAAVKRALEQYEAAQANAAVIDAQVAEVSATLDGAVAQQRLCQERLRVRVVAMYRSGDASTLWLLLGASSIEELTERMQLLSRMAAQDAENLRALKVARAEATQWAEELLKLQADGARALDALGAEVTRAKKDLAASEAALQEYEARVAASAKAAAAPAKSNPTQQLTGSGEWRSGVASHYGINFTGRGASGEAIGPYSMIVAHRTLPFGTLIEFEYSGKRAVARVADRGPHVEGREFDLGPGVVRVLGFSGVHEVRYRIITQ